jgi:transposase
MLKRYELTDQEWEQIVPLIPYNKGKRGRPPKDDRLMLNAMVWLARSSTQMD